jgi:hypothetical protein
MTTALLAALALALTISEPVANAHVGRRFSVQGHTIAGGEISVTAGPRRGAVGQFSEDTKTDAHGNFHVNVVLRTLRNQQAVFVRVTATDPKTSQSAATTLALRLSH